MKKIALVVIMLAAVVMLKPSLLKTEPITYYQYITNYERTIFNEIIWFWTADTLEGPVRSNDFIGLKYSPHFFGPVITSKDRFIYYQLMEFFEIFITTPRET